MVRTVPGRSIDAPRLDHMAIIKTAAAVVDGEGIDALTAARLSSELRIRPTALYRYVSGIDEVLHALALHAREILVVYLQQATLGRDGHLAVRGAAYAWREFVRDHPGLYTVTSRVPVVGDASQEAAVLRVVEVLARSIASYDLGPTLTMHAARSLRSALHGFTDIEKDGGHPTLVDLDDSFEHLVDLLAVGIAGLQTTRDSLSARVS